MINKYYQVARHIFSIELSDMFPFWDFIHRAYSPFEVKSVEWERCEDVEHEVIFTLRLVDSVVSQNAKMLFSDDPMEDGFVKIDIYSSNDDYYMEFTQFGSESVNGKVLLSPNGGAQMELIGTPMFQWMTFTNIVQVLYFMRTAMKGTVMVHSSAVWYDGKAYLFLGKSGTGKSTHSRMWLKGVEGAELMNDDHPIVRINPEGLPIAYGSPWSGKTHCYKAIEAPIGAIVRIRQEKENVLRKLKTIEAYGSVLASCSGFPIERRFSDGKNETVKGIISGTSCWELGCLPNVEAALVCMEGVTNGD